MNTDASAQFHLLARLLMGTGWLWFAFAVFYLTDAACNFLIYFALAGSGLLIGFAWLILTLVWPHLLWKSVTRLWYTVPLAGLIGVVLATTEIGLLMRVRACEFALVNYVDGVAAEERHDRTKRWVGLFLVEQTTQYDGGVYLFTSQSFLNSHGVARIPPGSRVAPRMRTRHLFGEWYSFEWKF